MPAFELKMPKLGESVTEGTIGKWLKQPGQTVAKYDLLVEVQTDKVNTEIPSPVAGVLKEVKVKEGDTVPIGTLLAVFDMADGEAPVSPSQPSGPSAPSPGPDSPPAVAARAASPAGAPPAQSRSASTAATTRPAQAPLVDTSDVRATPAVRKIAAEHGVDISQIQGSGLGGRVSKKDVEDYLAARGRSAAPAAAAPARLAGDQKLPLTQLRRAVAANMVRAWSAPHAHAVMEIDMTNCMRYRDSVRGDFAQRERFDLSPAAFIVRAAVHALRAVPHVNASWSDDGLLLRQAINIGYAVALGDEGLIVPVIKDADEKSIAGLMRAIRDIVDRAKARKLTPDDITGGTFTVNNTGPLGTIVSSPIVPPGQAAIVSSESILKRLVVLDDDSIAIRQMMNLVIGFDHRAIDGATAAKFLDAMREWLEAVGPTVPVY